MTATTATSTTTEEATAYWVIGIRAIIYSYCMQARLLFLFYFLKREREREETKQAHWWNRHPWCEIRNWQNGVRSPKNLSCRTHVTRPVSTKSVLEPSNCRHASFLSIQLEQGLGVARGREPHQQRRLTEKPTCGKWGCLYRQTIIIILYWTSQGLTIFLCFCGFSPF